MVTVDVGCVGNCSINGVLVLIHKHGGRIIDFRPMPNGDPNLTLGFETKGRALDFLIEFIPDEEEEVLLEQIYTAAAA